MRAVLIRLFVENEKQGTPHANFLVVMPNWPERAIKEFSGIDTNKEYISWESNETFPLHATETGISSGLII